MPLIEIPWDAIRLTYQLIIKRIFEVNDNSNWKVEIQQLLQKHLDKINKNKADLSNDTLSYWINEIELEKIKLSLNKNSIKNHGIYSQLLFDIIDVLKMYHEKFTPQNSMVHATKRLTSSLDSLKPSITHIVEPVPIIHEFQSIFSLMPNSYQIEAIQSIIMIELDRFFLKIDPNLQHHLIQLAKNDQTTLEKMAKSLITHKLTYPVRIILLFCCIRPEWWTHSLVAPYHKLIKDEIESSNDAFTALSETDWKYRQKTLKDFALSYLDTYCHHVRSVEAAVNSSNDNSTSPNDIDFLFDEINYDAEKLKNQLNEAMEAFQKYSLNIKQIRSLNELFIYQENFPIPIDSWKKLTPHSQLWKKISKEFEFKQSFLSILQSILYLIENPRPFDELPQRFSNYLEVLAAYQTLADKKILHQILKNVSEEFSEKIIVPTLTSLQL